MLKRSALLALIALFVAIVGCAKDEAAADKSSGAEVNNGSGNQESKDSPGTS